MRTSETTGMTMRSFVRRLGRIIGGLAGTAVILYLILLIPGSQYTPPVEKQTRPFSWNQDEIWQALERRFLSARQAGCTALSAGIDSGLADTQRRLDRLALTSFQPESEIFDSLEHELFVLAAEIGTCPEQLPAFISLYSRLRAAVKDQSVHWDMGSRDARETVYRLLYGGRQAIEEIMLQAPPELRPALIAGHDEPSSTPAAAILGVPVHSGDILVSRGGAPTSALIARGNDYPGNFSHVALLHVDEQTGAVSIIESHIECGVLISTPDQYLQDTKFRIMVLRLRSDLPYMVDDPMLPHKAASLALADATQRSIPYDFAMDFGDSDRMFCSEVASAAYRSLGVTLWMSMSRMSSPGLRSWLGMLGVRHFETQEPSDLEYDPQLCVVAEWRNPETLYKDHLDNAALDVMLESSDSAQSFAYDLYLLPVARVTKWYSAILNLLGAVGPIPEGMSPVSALRIQRFSRRHAALVGLLGKHANAFRRANGYTPPYWALIDLARQAKSELNIP